MRNKLMVWLVMGILFSAPLMAQEVGQKGEKKGLLSHQTELNLNDEQVAQIKEINKSYASRIKAAKSLQAKDSIKKIQEEKKEKIKQILTLEQFEKWQAIVKKDRNEKHNPALRKALNEYREKNILPVLSEKRKVFDSKLSAEEKQTIAEQRAKLSALKAGKKSLTQEEIRERRQQLQKEISETLKPIIEKHQSDFETLKTELAPNRVQWETDMNAIKAQFISNYKPNAKGKPSRNKYIQFLLIDVE